MRTEKADVKKDGKTIAQVDVEVYDSIEESVSQLGDETVLKMINRCRRNDLTNKTRIAASARTPDKEIARVTRELRKGAFSKAEAAEKIKELLAQL